MGLFWGKRESGVRSNLNKFNADFWQNWDFSIFFQILEVGVVDICEDWTYWESCPADFRWRIETDLQEAENIQGERYVNGLILKKWRTVNCWRREKWHQLPEETIVLAGLPEERNSKYGERETRRLPWDSMGFFSSSLIISSSINNQQQNQQYHYCSMKQSSSDHISIKI